MHFFQASLQGETLRSSSEPFFSTSMTPRSPPPSNHPVSRVRLKARTPIFPPPASALRPPAQPFASPPPLPFFGQSFSLPGRVAAAVPERVFFFFTGWGPPCPLTFFCDPLLLACAARLALSPPPIRCTRKCLVWWKGSLGRLGLLRMISSSERFRFEIDQYFSWKGLRIDPFTSRYG